MDFKARVTISRSQGGITEDHPISITIEDDTSSCELVEVRLTLADFAEALTGRGMVNAVGEFRPECPIGKRREVKEEVVTLPKDWPYTTGEEDRKKLAAPVLAPYEVDGWEGYIGDLFNHHRSLGGQPNKYRVTFIRFVDAEPV